MTTPSSRLNGIVAASPQMRRALHLVDAYAARHVPILIVGPTGAGKEVVAYCAHSARGRGGAFVDLNCGALPSGMAEALLFGARKGSYTSCVADVTGYFEQARGGTLYLDELCSLPLDDQAKLLRVLETGAMRRLGDVGVRHSDAYIVTSVQLNPHVLIAERRLREDLYYRLAVGLVHVPALAERPADIAPLAALFAARREKQLSARAVAVLKAYDWPGNVRELQSVVTRAATASSGETLSGRAMREALAADARPVPRDPVESRLLWETCFRHDWDMRAIARELRVSRATAYRRLNAHGVRRFRSDGAP